MPDLDEYRISELDPVLDLGQDDLMEVSVEDENAESGYRSHKSPLSQLGAFFNNILQYVTALKTGNKTITGAINQTVSNFANDYDNTSTYAVDDCVIYGGVLYKCTTAIAVAEAWDSTHWTQIKAVDVGTGGGGGGGHTIVDDSGTSLTQRSNLQFKGAYSEDNSTDDVTEVNVVRSMTKAEFDLLSNDEKQGLINITDDISGGLKYVKEVLWENLDESNMTILANGSTISLSDDILDYDEIYFEGCFFETNNSTDKKITHLVVTKVLKETIELAKSKYGTGQYEGMFDVAHNVIVSGQSYCSMYCLKVPSDNTLSVAFKYVNAWSANSCTLTRIIGIKYLSETENTYSTDEQIVGTWIDGSTLYERTFVVNNLTGNVQSWTNFADLSGVDKIINYDGVASLSDGAQVNIGYYVIVNASDNKLKYYCKEISALTFNLRLTIRYTKSST